MPLSPLDSDLRIAPASVIIVDRDLRVRHAAGSEFEAEEAPLTDYQGTRLDELIAPEPGLLERYRAALAGTPQSFDYQPGDGSHTYWVQITPLRDPDGTIGSVVAIIEDVTGRLRTAVELRRSQARLRDAERMIGIGSWELVPADGSVTYSDGFARATGIDAGERTTVETLLSRVHPDDRAALTEAIVRCEAAGTARGEYRFEAADGTWRTFSARGEAVYGDDGKVRYLRGAVLDVTEHRASERERLEAMSLFQQGFDAAAIGMALTDPHTGRYIRVNDAMCRMLGRSRDELTRLSIGEVTHPDDVAESDEARQRMVAGTSERYQSEKRYLRPDGTVVWAALHVAPVRDADGSVRALFAQKMDITERKHREAKLESDIQDALWLGRIRDALDNDRLRLYFQPIVDLRTGETVQRELLLRMRGEDGTVILPGEFLPVAERYGLISEIDRWVIREAAQLAATGLPVEINLSGASVADPAVIRELGSAIKQYGVDPSLLVVEVTETALMNQLEIGHLFAERVNALGCGLALDDFGTGFASLSYLKHIPARHLKIDMEFVRELTRSETDERLVRGIVGFAREFGQATIAEGIEDDDTLQMLRALGVDYGQGYLFGRPGPLKPEPRRAPAPPAAEAAEEKSLDSLALVRAAFDAVAQRDLDALVAICHPKVVLRAFVTMELAGREAPYRGHDGMRAYLDDVGALWDELELRPTMFWEADGATIAFGRISGRHDRQTVAHDVLWVCRVRRGLLASIDVFKTASEAGQPAVGAAGVLSVSTPGG